MQWQHKLVGVATASALALIARNAASLNVSSHVAVAASVLAFLNCLSSMIIRENEDDIGIVARGRLAGYRQTHRHQCAD